MACCVPQQAAMTPQPPSYMVEDGKAHYDMRVADIRAQGLIQSGVLFAGDSLTEGGDWARFFPNIKTANHGIGWDTSDGLLMRAEVISENRPDKIFILIGTNDLAYNRTPAQIADTVRMLVTSLHGSESQARIYLQSVLPREAAAGAKIAGINAAYKAIADDLGRVTFIDLTPAFAAPDGTLRADLTYDGLHLNQAGYEVWVSEIKGLVTAR
jgi:lysophospholipase L1-like esterase